MAHEFCMNCGFKVEYSLKSPNFCPNCGNAMDESAVASEQKVIKEETQPEVPVAQWLTNGLQYDISTSTKSPTVGDLIRDAQVEPVADFERIDRPAPPPSDKDALRESMDTCRPARTSEDVGG